MRYAGGAEHFPVAAVNGALVSGHQRCHDTGGAHGGGVGRVAGQAGKNRIAHPLCFSNRFF